MLAHKLEDLFAFYREKCGRIEHAEPELFDLLFEASDFVEKELERMTRQDYQPAGTEKLEAQTEVFLKRASGEADAAVAALLAGNLGYDPNVHCDHHDHAHGEDGHACGDHGCGHHGCH